MCLLYCYIKFYYINSSSLIWKYNFTIESRSLKTSHALYMQKLLYTKHMYGMLLRINMEELHTFPTIPIQILQI